MNMTPLQDDGETTSIVEPLIPEEASRHMPELRDLALELNEASTSLRSSLPDGLCAPVANLIRSMNCYYSNLIEGHDTHPIDIERALAKDFSRDPEQRNLQLEAVAHIEVQKWIDAGGLSRHPLDPESLQEIHLRFCESLPEKLLVTRKPDGSEVRIKPGELRQGYVQVGRHVAPSPGAVPRLLEHIRKMHGMRGRINSIIDIACSHHRLVWVHPFIDMNGRVSRMVTHAMLRDYVNSGGLWSASRGLARQEAEYKRRLMAADEPRHGGADGRGALSEQRLAEFASFFLSTCIDQARFMEKLMRPRDLRGRIEGWCAREISKGTLPSGSERVMREALLVGQVERGSLPEILSVKERQARNVSSALLKIGALTAESSRSPLVLNFPAKLASDWMPGLFPEE